MKRNILAVVIPALLAAGAANAAEIYNKDGNKLDLYGKVDGLHYFSKDKGNDGDQTYVRFGFKGETQITDQLTGYGQWEYNVQSNHAESQGTEGTKTRLGFAGLKFADYGSFDYGRNYGVLYDVEGWTDMLPEFGGGNFTNTCAATENCGGFASKTQNFEVTAQYQFDFGLRPEVSYLQSKGKNLNVPGVGSDQDLVKYVSVGTTYYFNKNMSTYVDYKINLLDDNDFTKATGIATDDIVGVGLVYQF